MPPTGAEVFPFMTGLPTGLDNEGSVRGVSLLTGVTVRRGGAERPARRLR